MAIPEAQLERWSHQGAVATAKKTHESIRNALDEFDWPSGLDRDIYLQGSYRNSTNIRGDSDVDVVVQLNSTFRGEVSQLSEDEQRLYQHSFQDAAYSWGDFRNDVLQALIDYYGSSRVQEGKKTLKVETSYLPADVIVCSQYREYRRFRSLTDQEYVGGMTFYVPSENRWVVNYPKLHYKNGSNKNSEAEGRYKPTIRMFKNARTYLIDQNVIDDAIAPSYFLECFLYNVPSSKYGASYQETFLGVIQWLVEHHNDWGDFICQNGQLRLFGDSPEQWSKRSAFELLIALVDLWDEWGS